MCVGDGDRHRVDLGAGSSLSLDQLSARGDRGGGDGCADSPGRSKNCCTTALSVRLDRSGRGRPVVHFRRGLHCAGCAIPRPSGDPRNPCHDRVDHLVCAHRSYRAQHVAAPGDRPARPRSRGVGARERRDVGPGHRHPQLARLGHDAELLTIGIVMWLAALGFYGVATWLILWRGAEGPGDDFWHPDIWILMGGLAIGTLAGDQLHRAGLAIVTHDWLLAAIRSATVVTWVAATLWIAP